MNAFREALFTNDALFFRTQTGQVLFLFTAELSRPPWVAQAWRATENDPWCSDFGGRYLERGDGRLIWQERVA